MVPQLVTWTSWGLETFGIVTVGLTAVAATLQALVRLARRRPWPDVHRDYRRELVSGIILGLEFLVAADIIGTVAVQPTFRGVGVLGAIVLIRFFLTVTLEAEVTGRWPWQSVAHPE